MRNILTLCRTRTLTHRKDLAAVYKDKALKNRAQEETKLTVLTHKILSIVHGFKN